MTWGSAARTLFSAPVQVAALSVRAGVAVADSALNTAVLTAGVAITATAVGAQVGVGLVSPVTAAPVRASRAVLRTTAAAVLGETGVGAADDLRSLIDPRPRRRYRRVVSQRDSALTTSALIEVRGLTSGAGAGLARALNDRLGELDGVRWWWVNAVTGHLRVGFASDELDVATLIALVAEAESAEGTATETWNRQVDHPSDREPVFAAALQLAGDLAGCTVAVAGSVLPLPHAPDAFKAVFALVDAQPRLRRALEGQLGPSRADMVITLGNAVALALGRGGSSLLVDAGQRAGALSEARARQAAWQQWARGPAGAQAAAVPDPLSVPTRPCPVPPGPIERFADQAATGSLVGSAASLAGQRSLANAAAALLVGVPKASRTSRESFASALSTIMCRRGVLPLDSAVWRRLDRVSAVVVDSHAVRGNRAMVLDAEARTDTWSTAHVWSAAQRLLGTDDRQDGQTPLTVPPPSGREGQRLRLVAVGRRRAAARAGDPRWYELRQDGAAVGRVLVGTELHPRADGMLVAARRAGLRVVLIGDASTADLRPRADEFVAAGGSTTDLVQRLQAEGHVVALVSKYAHRALSAADVAIGVQSTTADGAITLPWSADLVCADLAPVEQLLAATIAARRVSERGRTLALSASTLGGLLLVAGPRRGARLRATSPVTAAALAGLTSGTVAGWRAGRLRSVGDVPLVPWHALEGDDVLSRLPAPVRQPSVRTERRGWPQDTTQAVLDGIVHLAKPVVAPVRRPFTAALQLSRHVREELADPLTPVLSVGAAASAILGSPTDAILVGSVMGVNALVSALQRQRAAAAMHHLLLGEQVMARRLDEPRMRTPAQTELGDAGLRSPATALRPGDVIALRAGDVVPADARLLAVDGLELDESGLTGESVTVDKQTTATPGAALSDRACMVYEGAVVVNGAARAVVVAVGSATQAGRAVAAASGPPTGGVQAQLSALTDKALPLTLGGGAAVTMLGLVRGQLLRSAIADGVAVAVAAVPEGLPLVATVAQLAAARRLSRRGVLVRASRTVEALGRVDTMCFDKTGTLTEGRLRLVALADLDSEWDTAQAEAAPDARRLLRAAARACPQREDGPVVHATDRAVLDGADAHLGKQAAHVWDPLEEVPFESNRGYAATLGHTARHLRLVVKGAPEVLLPRCTRALQADGSVSGRTIGPMSSSDRKRAMATVHRLARRGLRVLVVARRDLAEAPEDVATAVEHLTLMGFIGLADTPRAATLPVLSELDRNHIGVRMITGDHPVTAKAIAQQLGISVASLATGKDLDVLNEVDQAALIERTTVFARVTPEHKVRIITALQRGGHVVAMTGDGSNDAAAIRTSDVGIGIAAHGSAAARNAADLVLTEPDITLLLDALAEGRAMWQRVRDAVGILVGGNAGEVAFTLLGTAIAGRAPVGTRQFLLVNLLTDMFPAMAVALSHARPPREDLLQFDDDPASLVERSAAAAGAELAATPRPELGGELLRSVAARGIATAAGASAAWCVGRFTGTTRRASTMGLVALVGTQLGQTILVGGRSPLVWCTAAGSGAVLVAVVMTPGVSQFFGCTPLDPAAWLVVGASAAGATVAAAALPPLIPRLTAILAPAGHRLGITASQPS